MTLDQDIDGVEAQDGHATECFCEICHPQFVDGIEEEKQVADVPELVFA